MNLSIFAGLANQLAGARVLVDGGVEDGGLFRALALFAPGNTQLGSAALIDARWALCVSHCVRVPQRRLEVRTNSRSVEVQTIHWQSGHKHELQNGLEAWPSDVGGLPEQFVLLYLAASLDEPYYANPTVGIGLRRTDLLLVVGFGVDNAGTYAETSQLATRRYGGGLPNGRGATYRDPRLIFNGEARADDSGAPVYHPDVSGIHPSLWLRLVGLHSGRSAAIDMPSDAPYKDGAVIGEFLRIDRAAYAWIKWIKDDSASPVATPSPQPALKTSTNPDFKLRGRFNCVNCAPGDLGGNWHLEAAAGTGRVLVTCGTVKIKAEPDGSALMTVALASSDSFACKLTAQSHGAARFASGYARGYHVYVFRRTDGKLASNTKKRLRIELFSPYSQHTHPQSAISTTGLPAAGDSDSIEACPGGPTIPVGRGFDSLDFTPDQDEEGNGYEG
jgi:hypothetical protein